MSSIGYHDSTEPLGATQQKNFVPTHRFFSKDLKLVLGRKYEGSVRNQGPPL